MCSRLRQPVSAGSMGRDESCRQKCPANKFAFTRGISGTDCAYQPRGSLGIWLGEGNLQRIPRIEGFPPLTKKLTRSTLMSFCSVSTGRKPLASLAPNGSYPVGAPAADHRISRRHIEDSHPVDLRRLSFPTDLFPAHLFAADTTPDCSLLASRRCSHPCRFRPPGCLTPAEKASRPVHVSCCCQVTGQSPRRTDRERKSPVSGQATRTAPSPLGATSKLVCTCSDRLRRPGPLNTRYDPRRPHRI
jgi:hypothetical protein